MTIHVTPIPRLTAFGVPALTLGLANAAGTAETTISTDSTLLVFDSTLPDAITFGQSGAAGSATVTARRDHAHGMATETPANLVVIGTVAADDSATLTVTGLSSTYDIYLVTGSDIIPATDSAQMQIRLGDSSGVDSGGSDYQWERTVRGIGASTYTSVESTGDTDMQITSGGVGNATGEGGGFVLWLTNPGDATSRPRIEGTSVQLTGGTALAGSTFVGTRTAVITVDRIQFLFSAGNVTSGRFTVWGLAHA